MTRRARRATAALLLFFAVRCHRGEERQQDQTRDSLVESGLPGARPRPQELAERIAARLEALGPDHHPRTRHLRPDGSPKYTNRLIFESSPYLLQHAHNPVDWYPWGKEALAAARELGRPIFLSIGYSTCHWCHVMEEESFEDVEVARYLNENYIAIKVDREERPDLDSIYMAAVQKMGLSGGWPLNVWLTPEGKPFFGGTYFAPRKGVRGARMSFLSVLERARDKYAKEREKVAGQAGLLVRELQRDSELSPGDDVPGPEVLRAAARFYRDRFDDSYGGLRSRSSKFPSSLPIGFLLRYARRTGDRHYQKMALLTLEKMAAGGIYDQVGGGFHRYSTDPRWRVPHFEKMLYDNARLAVSYLEAYQASGREDLAAITREILAYAARDMSSPGGGFYSATDADSPAPGGEREEGYYFTWTPAEVKRAVAPERAELALRYYGVSEHGDVGGRSVLRRTGPLAEVAASLGLEAAGAAQSLAEARRELYRARQRRPPPSRDDKILTAYNGLMISAFARAARVLGADPDRDLDYRERAVAAARFVLRELYVDGRLRRSYAGKEAHLDGYLDDYAYFIAALLDLYEATADPRWLDRAIELDRVLAAHYEDPQGGGFYLTSDDREHLFGRRKPAGGGALPSGNSVAAMNLLRLYQLTTESAYLERADRLLRAFAGRLRRDPVALAGMLGAVDFRCDAAKEIVLIAPSSKEQAKPFLDVLGQTYLPNRVLVVAAEKEREALASRVPLVEEKRARGGRPTAYVCEEQRCRLPTSDPQVFARQIAAVEPLPAIKARGDGGAGGGARRSRGSKDRSSTSR